MSPFSDDILYTLDFVGEKANLDVPGIKYDESDFVIMKTPHNEEYKCYLPQDKLDADDEPDEIGAAAEDLLDSLMKVQANNKPQCTPGKSFFYYLGVRNMLQRFSTISQFPERILMEHIE